VKIKRDQVTGLVLVLLGIAVAILVSQFKKEMTAAYPGPKLFPLIATFGFLTCGSGIFLSSCFSKKEQPTFMVKEGWIKIIAILVVLCASVFLLKYVGFLLLTPFALLAFCLVMAKGDGRPYKLWALIVFSVVFTVFVYVMYVHVFNMTLPMGILFE